MMDDRLTEIPVGRRTVFEGKVITVRCDTARLPNGSTASREVVCHPGGVCIAPLTAKGELLFVRQFRYPFSQIVTELPAGKLEPGEDSLSAGIRELREETGATARSMTSLGHMYPTPGYCGEIIHLYLATGLVYGERSPDEDEFLDLLRPVPLEQAVKMVMEGELPDAKTQLAVLKLWFLRESGKL